MKEQPHGASTTDPLLSVTDFICKYFFQSLQQTMIFSKEGCLNKVLYSIFINNVYYKTRCIQWNNRTSRSHAGKIISSCNVLVVRVSEGFSVSSSFLRASHTYVYWSTRGRREWQAKEESLLRTQPNQSTISFILVNLLPENL